jgi:hypothetical protein
MVEEPEQVLHEIAASLKGARRMETVLAINEPVIHEVFQLFNGDFCVGFAAVVG